ncbi:hypothetical protein [Parafilimonas sp.]|uniref:hypothetical protein n=1 Tax=Parafilimonas sp. TaxID=1969739 RepID=UPI0039E38768
MQPKTLFIAIFALLVAFATHAQDHNPYKDIGKQGKVLTVTNGEYDEFFDEDSIQQVGSALVNINTMQLVKLKLTPEEQKQFDNSSSSRFLSVDPLTSSFPELTPYQYASNNPIMNIDLEGLEGIAGNMASPGKWHIPGDANDDGHLTKQELKEGGTIMTATALLPVEVFVTKGWITRTLFASQIAGAFEHNRAKTPEARTAQDQRSKDALSNAFLTWGAGKIIGTSLNFFKGPLKESVNYLFRGTSEGFEGSPQLQKIGITPTSSDPVVATIFSINSKNYGNGVLQVALPKDLQGVEYTGNVLQSMEKEIGVGLKPAEFAQKTSITITSDQARDILKNMGINLPAKISTEDISSVIKNTPRLSESQIDEFYKQASKVNK